ELPTINCPATVTVCADAGQPFASAVNLGAASSSDNCGAPVVTNNAPLHFPIGTNQVVWTATDTHGNQNMCVQQVIVTPAVNLPHSITGLVNNGDGSVTIDFAGTAGATYQVQASTNLVDWVTIGTNTPSEGGFWSFTDSEAAHFPMRFYRAARQ